MNRKDEVQKVFIDQLSKQFCGINRISVRAGKCRIYLRSIQNHSKNYIENPKVLILYPNTDVRASWEAECIKIGYSPNITYSTYLSIDKVINENWDYIVADEAHLCGEEVQLPKLGELVKRHSNTIIASGTYSNKTLDLIRQHTNLDLTIDYPTEQAIADGIVCNFNINVYIYPLDDKTSVEYGKIKKWKSTELKECNRLSRKVDTTYGKEKMFHALNRMRFINSCNSLVNVVNAFKEGLGFNGHRFILFSGDENVGKRYNLPMYNSKSKDDSVLRAFQTGEINQLCLVKKGRQGVTFPDLRHIIITNIDSNGENLEQAIGRALLNDTENATIHIFVSNQLFQQKWLNSALSGINPEKIKYINV